MPLTHRETNGSPSPANKSSGRYSSSVLDLLGPDDPLRKEMEQLLSENQQLMQQMGGVPRSDAPAPSRSTRSDSVHRSTANGSGSHHGAANSQAEMAQLREENARLRARVAELEQRLAASSDQSEEVWAEQLQEYEALLQEKSETIRHLHQELQELRQGGSSGNTAHELALPSADLDELTALQRELEMQRRQFEEDEQALMEQARQMELTMSRERVELARQRNELQQLHRQIQREIEAVSRDGDLRERLTHLQRRHEDTGTRSGDQPPPRRALPTQKALIQENLPEEKTTGFFGRLFGK